MQPEPCFGLLVVLAFLLVGLKLLIGGSPGHSFWLAFWQAVWQRILIGSRRQGGTNPLGCIVLIGLVVLLLSCIGPMMLLALLGALAGSVPK